MNNNNLILLYQSDTEPNKISLNNWKQYCSLYNLQLIYFTDLVNPQLDRLNQIFYIFKVLEANQMDIDNICFVSDSTLINVKSTKNIFDLHNNKLTYAEWDGDFSYLLTHMEMYSENAFNNFIPDFSKFFDLGFFIINKGYKDVFNKILSFIERNYNTIKENKLDITYIPQNFFLNMCEGHNKLTYTYNMIEMNRKELLFGPEFIKLGNIFNFTGIDNKNELMKEVSQLL